MTRTLRSTADELPPAHKRAVVLAIVALHGLAGWALLQVAPVRAALAQAAPMMVDLLAPPAPEPPREQPPAPPPPPQPLAKKPPPAPVMAAAPSPAPAPFVVPEAPPPPAPPAPPAPPEPVEAVVVAPPAPPAPPPPREIPPAAVQYLEPPSPRYPRLSRRLGESGLVIVRVFVDVDGLPRTVEIAQSSGFARLDEAALEGVRRARFKPYAENGRPSAGWARIPIPFELEK